MRRRWLVGSLAILLTWAGCALGQEGWLGEEGWAGPVAASKRNLMVKPVSSGAGLAGLVVQVELLESGVPPETRSVEVWWPEGTRLSGWWLMAAGPVVLWLAAGLWRGRGLRRGLRLR